jgi:2-amino-4-hydroxy-6-hydroxymethyldihydropteridine diphosphokinase
LIERKLGRIRTKKNDPRIIDIDIIDFNAQIKKNKILTLPHPKCHLRNFVLYPILQIDPNWSHPIFKKNVQFLINKLGQKLRIEITRLHKNVNINL